MTTLEPQRRDELLALAEGLAGRLRSAEVPYLTKPGPASRGVTPSTLAHAVSYLARVRDRERFGVFLEQFDTLDPLTAQNPDNPKAEHRVVRGELEAFLADQPALSAVELLYVLAWVRRLLPRSPNGNGPKAPGRSGRSGHSRQNGGAATPAGGRFRTQPPTYRPPHRPAPPLKAPEPARPPGETLWKGVTLELWQGTPTIFKGNQNASCGKDGLPAGLLKKLKKRKRLQVDARVVRKGGGEWRIADVEEVD